MEIDAIIFKMKYTFALMRRVNIKVLYRELYKLKRSKNVFIEPSL